jgi:hypothetical protein
MLYLDDWGSNASSWINSTARGSTSWQSSDGNPDGYLRYNVATNSFSNKGITTTKSDATGDYGAAGIVAASFDVRIENAFDTVRMRLRPSSGGNGWEYMVDGGDVPTNAWTTISVPLDPSWDDATAISNGWMQMSSTTATFAATTGGVAQVYLQAYRGSNVAGEHVDFDNFELTDVAIIPEPASAVTAMFAAVGLGWNVRRRRRRSLASSPN